MILALQMVVAEKIQMICQVNRTINKARLYLLLSKRIYFILSCLILQQNNQIDQ